MSKKQEDYKYGGGSYSDLNQSSGGGNRSNTTCPRHQQQQQQQQHYNSSPSQSLPRSHSSGQLSRNNNNKDRSTSRTGGGGDRRGDNDRKNQNQNRSKTGSDGRLDRGGGSGRGSRLTGSGGRGAGGGDNRRALGNSAHVPRTSASVSAYSIATTTSIAPPANPAWGSGTIPMAVRTSTPRTGACPNTSNVNLSQQQHAGGGTGVSNLSGDEDADDGWVTVKGSGKKK